MPKLNPKRAQEFAAIKDEIMYLMKEQFRINLYACEGDRREFRVLSPLEYKGRATPVLIVGWADKFFVDGHCLALLDPDGDLLEAVNTGWSWDLIRKRCSGGRSDAAFEMWPYAPKLDMAKLYTVYRAR